MNNKIITGKLVISFVLLLGCSKDDIVNKNDFNVFKYRQTYATSLIKPAITKFVLDASNLNQATTNFIAQTNAENLLVLQNLWKTVALSYAKTEIGNLGDIQTSAVYLSMYSWGANEIKIEELIASTTTIDENNINSMPTKTRGLTAIEYLLFSGDLKAIINSFSNERRKEILTALVKNLHSKSISLHEQWEIYTDFFINNTAIGINGSINLIVNQLNFLLEDVLRFKIGEPAGLDNSSNANTALLQAYRSEISLEIIQENIAAAKVVYYGIPDGLDDYVSSITGSEDINTSIATAFSGIENNIASLSNTSLKNAIENNNFAVNELYHHIKNLIVLIKVDVASSLSVTVTFTDNDGD
jgi:predicted lipoprotein